MEVHLYGVRGSTPGQPRGSNVYGAHTTCLRVVSDCIPQDHALVADAGSGFVSLSCDLMKEGVKNIAMLFTHYHHDHTQGIFLAPHTFAANSFRIWGPKEHGVGPNEVLTQLMASPLFPVEFAQVKQRFQFGPLDDIGTKVLVVHPQGGFHLIPVDIYRKSLGNGKQLAFRQGKYDISECLVVHMFKTVHPEYTVSYRFEEKPTGRVFVFLTDHEKTAAFPQGLLAHLKGAHLLIQDGQYSEETYRTKTAGYGHGTPEYCAETAHAASVEKLGLTHHDPNATDTDIEKRLSEAVARAVALGNEDLAKSTFACADYLKLSV